MKKHLTLKNLGWLFSFIVSLVIFISAWAKVFPSKDTLSNFALMNMADYLGLIAFMEIFSVLMFLTNRFISAGVGLISVIMGAAISAHIIAMENVGVELPIIILILTWSGYVLRKHVKE